MADASRPDSPASGADRDRARGDSLSSPAGALEATPPGAPGTRPPEDPGAGPSDDATGSARHFGRYVVKSTLAKGGMGEVLEAWDPALRRFLALKVNRTVDEGLDERARARFLDEAQIGGRLDHPGIVPVHDLGQDDLGQPYFTMRLVAGRTLQQILERQRAGDEESNLVRVLGIVLKVCEAMAFAHDRGIVHRDLKPANVMVGRFGEVYVMDWGLARCQEDEDPHDLRPVLPELTTLGAGAVDESPLMTMQGDVIGTPAFMSPEQALGQVDAIGPGTDVYAVGSILYQLGTGTMPYVAPGERVGAGAVWERVRAGPPRPMAELAPRLPEELVAICEKAMAREIDDRYPDMAALATDLRAFLEGRVVSAHRTGAVAEFRKWVQRNRPVAVTITLSLVTVMLGSLVATALLAAYNDELLHTRELADARRFQAESALDRESEARRAAELSATREETARVAAEAAARSETIARKEAEDAVAREVETRREAEVATAREAVARRKAEAAESDARWQAYRANLAAAAAHLAASDFSDAGDRLDACEGDLAGWERDVLSVRQNPALRTWASTDDAVYVSALALSPDGTRVATGGSAGALVIRALPGGDVLAEPPLTGYVRDLVFTPDGRRLIVAEGEAGVTQRDAMTGVLLSRLRGHQGIVNDVAASADGRLLASASDDATVRIWEASTGETLARLVHAAAVRAVAFDGRDALIATGDDDGVVHLWDVATRGRLSRFERHAGPVHAVVFDATGERLASAGDDGEVRVWEVATGRVLHRFAPGAEVYAAAFGPEGRLLAGDGRGVLHLYDTIGGREIGMLHGHRGAIHAVLFTVDGGELLSTSSDGTLRLWDAATRPGPTVLPAHDDIATVVVESADGAQLASGSFDRTVRLWDGVTGDPLQVLRGHRATIMSLAFALDGRRLASSDRAGGVLLWDTASGLPVAALESGRGQIAFVTSSRDGRLIASASGGRGHPAYEPTRRLMNPLEGERTISLWDPETGARLRTLPGQRFATTVVAFSGDGRRLVSGSQGGGLAVWDPETGELIATLATEPSTGSALDLPPVSFLAVDETGGRIVSAHLSRLVSLVVWDGETGERRQVLRGHDRRVWGVALTPSGDRVLSTGEDGTVRVWDAGTGAHLLALREPALSGLWLTLSSDGRRLLAPAPDGSLVIWDTDVGSARTLWHGEDRRERAAPIVAGLLETHVLPSRARAALASGAGPAPELRPTVDRLLAVMPEPSMSELNRAAWNVVRRPGAAREDYERALAWISVAVERSPDTPALLNTLGVTLYRLGRPDEALDTLARADALNVADAEGYNRASDLLVMAMCLAQLDRGDEARQVLAVATELVSAGDDPDLTGLAAEATALLEMP